MADAKALLPQPATIEEYMPLRGDPAIWLPAVRVIAERHGLDPNRLFAEATGTNVVFRAGDSAWIKLIVPLWKQDFEREQCALAALRDTEEILVPELLAEGDVEGWPYIVMGCVPGRSVEAVWSGLDRDTQVGIAADIGELMARLHAIDPAGLKALDHDWATFMQHQRERCLTKHASAGASDTWLADIEQYVASVPVLDEPGTPNVFLHADLTDDHVLVDKRDGRWRVTGVIDFADAMLGQPLYEFAAPAVFLMQRQPWAQRALLGSYGFADAALTTDLARRLTAYTMLHRFGRLRDFLRFCPEPTPRTMAELQQSLFDF